MDVGGLLRYRGCGPGGVDLEWRKPERGVSTWCSFRLGGVEDRTSRCLVGDFGGGACCRWERRWAWLGSDHLAATVSRPGSSRTVEESFLTPYHHPHPHEEYYTSARHLGLQPPMPRPSRTDSCAHQSASATRQARRPLLGPPTRPDQPSTSKG